MTSSTELQDELAGLRAIVADETKPLTERTAAAALIVQLTVDGVPDPVDDDEEVVELRKPWADGGPLSDVIASVFKYSRTGYPLAEARAEVLKRHRERAILAVVVDEAAHCLIRVAACQTMLDSYLPAKGRHRLNGYTAERLLAAVIPADGHKWTSAGKQSVERPPRVINDVW